MDQEEEPKIKKSKTKKEIRTPIERIMDDNKNDGKEAEILAMLIEKHQAAMKNHHHFLLKTTKPRDGINCIQLHRGSSSLQYLTKRT